MEGQLALLFSTGTALRLSRSIVPFENSRAS